MSDAREETPSNPRVSDRYPPLRQSVLSGRTPRREASASLEERGFLLIPKFGVHFPCTFDRLALRTSANHVGTVDTWPSRRGQRGTQAAPVSWLYGLLGSGSTSPPAQNRTEDRMEDVSTATRTRPTQSNRRTTYLSLPEDLRRVAKARSALLGEPLSHYVARLLRKDLLRTGMLPSEE
jgi:hypothetical protein